MKKLLFYLLLSTFSFAGMAQEFNPTELNFMVSAEKYMDGKRTEKISAMHVTNKHITTVRFVKKYIFWDVFDGNMNKMFAGMIKKERNEEYLGHANAGNTIQVFTVYKPRSATICSIFCYTLDADSNTHSKTEVFVSDYNTTEEQRDPLSVMRRVLFATSPNHQYVAIAMDDYNSNRNSYVVRVLDTKNLNLVYETSFSKDKEKYFQQGDFTVNDAAEVFTIGRTFFKGTRQRRKGKINYEYTLHKLTKDKTSQLTIPVQTKFLKSLQINEYKGKLSLIGFYADENIRDINGIFTATVNKKNMSLIATKQTKLPAQVYQDLFRKEEAERRIQNQTGLPNYSFHDLLVDSKGNAYLCANISQNVWSGGFSSMTIGFHGGGPIGETLNREYENMVICKLNTKGEVLWGRGLEIKPLLVTPYMFLKDDMLQMMITSDCNMRERKGGRMKFTISFFGKSCLLHMTLAPSSEFTFHTYSYRSTLKSYYEPSEGFYANGIFVIPENHMKNKRFLKMY
ncbi:MAG: hypothetical protein AAF611_00610 [Bacteroidota bacterium]